jgi:hypothetical protein
MRWEFLLTKIKTFLPLVYAVLVLSIMIALGLQIFFQQARMWPMDKNVSCSHHAILFRFVDIQRIPTMLQFLVTFPFIANTDMR